MTTNNLTMQEKQPLYDSLDKMIEETARYIVKTRKNYTVENNYQNIRQLVYRAITISRSIEQGDYALPVIR